MFCCRRSVDRSICDPYYPSCTSVDWPGRPRAPSSRTAAAELAVTPRIYYACLALIFRLSYQILRCSRAHHLLHRTAALQPGPGIHLVSGLYLPK